MGKADMNRDYYADLELQPTAELAEIKKQFKKLALKWHPDRNPGREAEVNAKFQTIQSAHEILTDEVERRKYDVGRARPGRFTASTAHTRGNPYANAGAQWAPPPKPYGTPRANASGQSASGASKYTKFSSTRPTPNKPADQETKQQNYQAFQNMRKPPPGSFAKTAETTSTRRGQWQSTGSTNVPDPKSTPQSGREESGNQRYPPPPKSGKPGYDEWNAAMGRRSPKKSGFAPGDPGGDEPPAPTASAYYNGRPARAPTTRNPLAPEPPPRSNMFEGSRDLNEALDGVNRQSTPYATQGGEKTNPFETSTIHRSSTTRELPTANGTSRAGEARNSDSSSGNTRHKQRSATPPPSRNRRNVPPPMFNASFGSPPKRNHSHINLSPKSSTGNRRGSEARLNTRFKTPALSDTSSEDEHSDVVDNHSSSKRLPRRKVPVQNEANTIPGSHTRGSQQQSSENLKKPNKASQPIFPISYRTQPSSVPPSFTPNNAESINTTFETEKWDGQFRAASFVNPTEFNNGPPRAAGRNGRRSPTKSRSTTRTRSASASLHSQGQPAVFEQPQAPLPSMESPVKPFAPEEWITPGLFHPSTFAPPATQGTPRPAFGQRTPSRKGSKIRTANRPYEGMSKDVSSESESDLFEKPRAAVNDFTSTTTIHNGAPSPNAMDIDSPYDGNGETSETSGVARNVPVEPLRPEWRAGAINGAGRPSNGASQSFTGSSKGVPDAEDDLKTNFDDLKNVEPLFQPAVGLHSVNDLKSSLPFQSTASDTVPLEPDKTNHINVKIPIPPVSPRVPSRPAVGAQRMSPSSWQSYLLAFQAYLADYQLYDGKIQNHFAARRAELESLRSKLGWRYLESKSDEFFEKHLAAVKVDALVTEKWAEAGKGHLAAMEQFRSVRAAMMGRTEE